MVLEPTPEDDIEASIESRLRGQIFKLTNFIDGSFNKLLLGAFAEQLYEYEVRLLAAQLSGWVDYAGGPITQEDLDRLGLDEFDDLELLNEYMLDSHLDNIGILVGTTRDTGSTATGQVRVETFDSNTRVPDGMAVATPEQFDGEQYTFEVDLGDDPFVTPADQNNADFVEVSVVATGSGTEYNVGSNTVTRFRSPPPGVESVTNPASIDGGQDPETNDEFRQRIKNAVFETSGGGTTDGIRGYLLNNVANVTDVFIDEFKEQQPIFVDVIVDGGTDSAVRDGIDIARPAGVQHNLVRPVTNQLAVDIEVEGTDIDTLQIKDEIESYLFELDLGDPLITDKIVQRVLNIEPNVENVLALNIRVVSIVNYRQDYQSGTSSYELPEIPLGSIDNETHYYTGDTSVYELNVAPIAAGSTSVTATVNDEQQSVADTEYDIVDDNGDGMLDSIDWSVGTVTPDSGTTFTVSYDTKTSADETFTYDGSEQFELTYVPALAGGSSVSDTSGDSYTLGTDYDIVDTNGDGAADTLEWLDGGTTPDSSEDFTVSYEIDVGSINFVSGTVSGSSYNFTEGTDYDEQDADGDGYTDSIEWLSGTTPDDDTVFTVDMSVQTDVIEDFDVDPRKKISPVVDEITVTQYE